MPSTKVIVGGAVASLVALIAWHLVVKDLVLPAGSQG